MTEFSDALKSWRTNRRLSQLELATQAEISSRHLSFLETGRSQPSREMVLRLCETLQIPLEARNQMLNQAGFASVYGPRAWSDDQQVPVREAIDRMLESHLPYPGLVLDRRWTIVQMNKTAKVLYGQLDVQKGDSLIQLICGPVLPEIVGNWTQVAASLASRLRIESQAQGGVEEFDNAASHLAKAGGPVNSPNAPIIPTILSIGGSRMNMFATIAQFGTPEDAILEDLKIELYFPADEGTNQAFEFVGSV